MARRSQGAALVEDHAGGGRARPAGSGAATSPALSSYEAGGVSMAKLHGRGVAAVNYPTGMNLGGDPEPGAGPRDDHRQLRRHAVLASISARG